MKASKKIPKIAFEWDIDEHLNPYIPAPRLHRLPYWIAHFLGYRRTDEDFTTRDHHHSTILFWAFIGEFVSLLIIEAIFMNIGGELEKRNVPYIFPAFGASAVLLFNAVDSPLTTPRAFVLGHFFCSIIGVGIPKLFALSGRSDLDWLSGALACSIATGFMRFTNTIHPPAGATALLPSANKQVRGLGWWYLPAVLLMTMVMLVTALLVDNIQRRYPEYWWTPLPLGKVPKEKDVEAGNEIRREMTRRSRRASEGGSTSDSGPDELWEEKGRVEEEDIRGSNRTLVDSGDDDEKKQEVLVIDMEGVHMPEWMSARLGIAENKVLEQMHALILQRCRENAELVEDSDKDGSPPKRIRSQATHKGH